VVGMLRQQGRDRGLVAVLECQMHCSRSCSWAWSGAGVDTGRAANSSALARVLPQGHRWQCASPAVRR
jgi:hypothetical protein